ncbi:MAG: ABC transporter permease [Pseudonocardiaceae bacterium]
MNYADFWAYYGDGLLAQMADHFLVVITAATIGAGAGLAASAVAYRSDRASELLIKLCNTLLTIPSLALYVLLLGWLGLGWPPVLVALTLYSLLPVVQNAIVGLRGVDPAIVESARGIGMSTVTCLRRVELPLAWPVILTGIRVSAAMLVTAATIGAVVLGPGLGNPIYTGLKSMGTPSALYFVLTGIAGVILVGLTINLALGLAGRLTVSRGIRD